jgi:hypothetical protein
MKKLSILFVIMLAVLLIPPMPIYAITLPESMSIPDVKVYRNLTETGDMLYVFEYNIAFTSDNFSDTSASDSFIFRLYDTDGTTLRATSSPYVYSFFNSNGYAHGVSSFYFSANDTKPSWNSAVTIQLYGTPAYFSPAQVYNYTLTSSKYTTSTTSEANQSELYNYVLLLSDRLASYYNSTGIILKATSDSGIILSSYGELYFRGAIPGLQTICPNLFYIQVYVPERMDSGTTYNMTMESTYTARHAGDDLGRGLTRLGTAMGVSGAFVGAGICFVSCIAICIIFTRKGWGVEFGMFISAIIATGFALILGNIMFTILIISSLVAAIALVWLFLLKRT